MLRKFLFLSIAVATLASCKKDKNDTPAYNLSAKVDGTKVDFNTTVVAQKDGNAQNGYSVVITGLGGSASSPYPAFSIFLDDAAVISAKTYTAADADVSIIYAASGQASYTSDTEFTVTISSITDTEVKGSFSGKVDDSSGGIKTITEGTFSAKF
jgi:hypothetical protein